MTFFKANATILRQVQPLPILQGFIHYSSYKNTGNIFFSQDFGIMVRETILFAHFDFEKGVIFFYGNGKREISGDFQEYFLIKIESLPDRPFYRKLQ